MKKRFTEEQIIGFLREADKGIALKEVIHVAHTNVSLPGFRHASADGDCLWASASAIGDVQRSGMRAKSDSSQQYVDRAALAHRESSRT